MTGASSGIGDAFARALAAQGTDLVLVARREDRLEALAAELRTATGARVDVHVADLTTGPGLWSVEERLRHHPQPVDLLVNNAGFGTAGRFHELDLAREDEELRLNTLALLRLTHAALERMVPSGRGWILNVSSVAGFQPAPGHATYAATKAFVTSFTESLHEELKGTGVVATALCPGLTRTEFHQVSGGDAPQLPFAWMSAEQVVAESLRDLAKERVLSIPGVQYKALTAMAALVPRGVQRRVAAMVTRRL